jgi:hypothetical protein
MKRGDMIEVFKFTSGIYDTSLPPIFKMNKDTITRGHSRKIYLQRASKNIRENFSRSEPSKHGTLYLNTLSTLKQQYHSKAD